jgi:hypothetical protein
MADTPQRRRCRQFTDECKNGVPILDESTLAWRERDAA